MRKPLIFALVLIFTAASLFGCAREKYQKYTQSFDELFDTVTIVTGYEKNRGDFDSHFSIIRNEMRRLHELYDIYNDYEGLNNAKTINDNAGIAPVEVDAALIELIELGRQAHSDTNGAVNIALGSVLRLWREHREQALDNPDSAAAPNMKELKQASALASINDIIIDRENSTVFLKSPRMSLDLGALAKGFAVGRAGDLAKKSGFVSGIISAGGNIYISGGPMDGRTHFNIGVQNPFSDADGEPLLDTLSVNSGAVVTSGDYQRFFVADGTRYNHIIDPKTLMPASLYSGVTIIHKSSFTAEMLSTAVFILPKDEGLSLVESFGAEALWIYNDKSYDATDGYKRLSELYSSEALSDRSLKYFRLCSTDAESGLYTAARSLYCAAFS